MNVTPNFTFTAAGTPPAPQPVPLAPKPAAPVSCPTPIGVDIVSPPSPVSASDNDSPGASQSQPRSVGTVPVRTAGGAASGTGTNVSSAASADAENADAEHPDATNVYFTKLAPECLKEHLTTLVSGHSERVLEVRVLMHSGTGMSRGQGFVKYAAVEDAKAAVARFDGMPFMGKELCVCLAFDNKRGVCSDFSPVGRVFIRGIPRDITHGDLVALVSPHAVVRGCTMHLDRLAGQASETVTSKFAYVVVDTDTDAERIAAALHQTKPWPQGRRTLIARLAPRKQRTQEEIAENAARYRSGRHSEFWAPATPAVNVGACGPPTYTSPLAPAGIPAPAMYAVPQAPPPPGHPLPQAPYGYQYVASPPPGVVLAQAAQYVGAPAMALPPPPPFPGAAAAPQQYQPQAPAAYPAQSSALPLPTAQAPGQAPMPGAFSPAGMIPVPAAPPAGPQYGAVPQPHAQAPQAPQAPPQGQQWQYIPPPPPPPPLAGAPPQGMLYIPPGAAFPTHQ